MLYVISDSDTIIHIMQICYVLHVVDILCAIFDRYAILYN